MPTARTFLAAVLFPLLLAAPRPASAQSLAPVATPALGAQCDDLDTASLADAIDKELPVLRRMPAAQSFRIGDRAVSAADYAEHTLLPLQKLARQGAAALCAALPAHFSFFRNPGAAPGKFTAYYNPLFRGSRQKTPVYRFPLYRRPPGALAQLTTAQILAGGLDGKNLELVYLADQTEALAAHVEGSATIVLPDNTSINVGSEGHNGQTYSNVSKLLLADNKIPKTQVTPVGMTRARKYFIDHPAELPGYWGKNPHFVFFKETNRRGGGKFGELVPGRSLAVDPSMVPLGLATWIRTDKPAIAANKVQSWVSFGRVAMAQDTGAGIIGAGRVDVFFGTGEYAEQAAAVTTRPGEIYVLLGK